MTLVSALSVKLSILLNFLTLQDSKCNTIYVHYRQKGLAFLSVSKGRTNIQYIQYFDCLLSMDEPVKPGMAKTWYTQIHMILRYGFEIKK